jgi:hypothetical protein
MSPVFTKIFAVALLLAAASVFGKEPMTKARLRMSDLGSAAEASATMVQYLRWLATLLILLPAVFFIVIQPDFSTAPRYPGAVVETLLNAMFLAGILLAWFRFGLARKLAVKR